MAFSEKLKALRLKNGLTQDELGEKLYLSRTSISYYEQGKVEPCPKCGSNDLVHGYLTNRDETKIRCMNCKILFCIFDTPENAIKLWNKDFNIRKE